MASTYIKEFRAPKHEGAGFYPLKIVGEDGVSQLTVEKLAADIRADLKHLPPYPAVKPELRVLPGGKFHVHRTAKNSITVSKPN